MLVVIPHERERLLVTCVFGKDPSGGVRPQYHRGALAAHGPGSEWRKPDHECALKEPRRLSARALTALASNIDLKLGVREGAIKTNVDSELPTGALRQIFCRRLTTARRSAPPMPTARDPNFRLIRNQGGPRGSTYPLHSRASPAATH